MSEQKPKILQQLRDRLGEARTQLLLGLALLVYLMIKMHQAVLMEFNFKTTDMDQVLMWFGVHEMRAGNFHMPRYWGQDYGSMLEAWISIPFTWVDYDKLLPYAAYFLLLLPYLLLIVLGKNGRFFALGTALATVCFLGAMPTEYIMMGAMPRDMVSGIAITSLGLLFVRNEKWYGLFLVGFFSLLGWSFNANAALFGATLTIYTLFNNQGYTLLKRIIVIGLGYALAGLIHVAVGVYLSGTNMIVHSHWGLKFKFSLLASGFENLDLHWQHIAVFFHDKGWVYLVIFAFLFIVAKRQKKNAVLFGALTLAFITCLSLGINKCHDATDSVFFSYARMYLALPVASLFLLTKLNAETTLFRWIIPAVAVMLYYQRENVKIKVDEYVAFVDNTVLTISNVESLKSGCKEIEEIWKSTQAQAIIFGPGKLHEHWTYSRACPCLTEIDIMVRPEYERKTWDLRELDHDTYDQFLWFSTWPVDSLRLGLGGATITKLDATSYFDNIYLVKGAHMNPMQIYKEAGFESVKYK